MGDGVAGDSCSAEVTAKGTCPRQIWLELSGEQAYPWHGKMAQPRVGTARWRLGLPEKCSCQLARAMGLSFDGQNMRMSGTPKIPFPFPKLNVWTLMGWYLPWLLREGQEMLGLWTMASWDVVAQSWDTGIPPAPVSQILGAVAWLSLLHRVLGTFLWSPELCCILGWVSVWGGTLKHPLGHAWPGHGLVGAGGAHPECATLPALPLVQLPRKLFQQPAKEETRHLLEQLFGASARRAAEDGNS